MTDARSESDRQPPHRTAGRRARQLLEIARLVDRGEPTRAAGLALEHAAEFPGDAELLTRLAPP